MDFCLAEVITLIKKSLYVQISDEDLLNLLIADIVTRLDLRYQDEIYYLDKKAVSKIMTHHRNVPPILRKSLKETPASVDSLEEFFSKRLIPLMIPEKLDVVGRELLEGMTNYDEASETVLEDLRTCINNKNLTRAIAIAFRYSLSVPNKHGEASPRKGETADKIDRRHPLEPLDFGGDDNLPCLNAVLAAYRSKDGGEQNCTIEDFPKRKNHYQRQKEAFFAAEAVRHAVRDSFLDGENPFHDLLDEGYDGIIDTWERSYPDGLDRMEAVLDQASHISMESNPISRETAWVTTKVKKGLCHELVNEGRIEGWLYDEGV